jgi:signal transduction histidine kinase
MAELLRGTSLSRKQQHYMDVVLDSGRSLLAMIEDILEFASIDAKKPGAELADFAVRTMMEETVGLVRDRAAAKGLILSLDVAPDVASAVSGDRSRLQQVLLRLIGNAIKFTDTGLVDVRVQAAGGDDHEVLLRFEVEDTGIGISPRDQVRIFDPFEQADGSTTRRHGGIGLGLAVAARMVEIMGGTLRVRSEAGKGSCFFFVLPFRKPALGPR